MGIRNLKTVGESKQEFQHTRCFCLPADFGAQFRQKWKGSECDSSSSHSKSKGGSESSASSHGRTKHGSESDTSSRSKPRRSHSAGLLFRSKGSESDSVSSGSILSSCLRGGFRESDGWRWLLPPLYSSSFSFLSEMKREVLFLPVIANLVPETEGSSFRGRELHWFPYKELENATDCFSASNLVPHLPYKAYRGVLPSGEIVNVRRLSGIVDSRFRVELKAQSRLEHFNLVHFIGFSDDQGEHLLVLEPICNGTLEHHLRGSSGCLLPWDTRLSIALGVARAIAYLHSQDPPVIHQDLRPDNLFLGDEFVGKVANYNSPFLSSEFVALAQSWEYSDPHSVSQVRTEECVVYRFGVILLQLLTGRPTNDPKTNKSLVHKVRKYQNIAKDGSFDAIRPLLDPLVAGVPDIELEPYLRIALGCIGDVPDDRPTIEEVVEVLENLSEHR